MNLLPTVINKHFRPFLHAIESAQTTHPCISPYMNVGFHFQTDCSWCPTVNRCSSGLDCQRQDWIKHVCNRHHVTEEDSCPAGVSETFTKEEAVVVEKEEESSVIDNSSGSREQKEEETDVTANSNDDTVQKEEDVTKEKVLNTEDVTVNTTLKTFEKNN